MIRMFVARISWVVFFLLMCSPLGWAKGAEPSVIKIEGSTTVLPIVARASERFRQLYPDVTITVNGGGSGIGVYAVGTGRARIGMMSREMTPDETERYRAQGLTVHVVGRDAVACVVSSEVVDAGVTALSRQQIRDIYRGKIRNWNQVGGPDRRIVVIDKERHRGTRQVFMNYLFGDPKARTPGTRLVTGSNNEEQAKVAQSDSAIGMLSFAWLNDEVRGISIRDENGLHAPTRESVKRGVFPIARNLNLVTQGPPTGRVKQFIDFILSPEGQTLVRQSGYVALDPVRITHSSRP